MCENEIYLWSLFFSREGAPGDCKNASTPPVCSFSRGWSNPMKETVIAGHRCLLLWPWPLVVTILNTVSPHRCHTIQGKGQRGDEIQRIVVVGKHWKQRICLKNSLAYNNNNNNNVWLRGQAHQCVCLFRNNDETNLIAIRYPYCSTTIVWWTSIGRWWQKSVKSILTLVWTKSDL